MPYLLPVRRRNGLLVSGVALDAVTSRTEIVDRALAEQAIINVPDTTPALGGKFPVGQRVGSDVYIAYSTSVSETVISETLEDGATPGDARTRARYYLNDGEAWQIKARLTDSDGLAYSYLAFVSVTVTVYDLSTGGVDIYTPADPALASIFLTSLASWQYDSYGYNFMMTILPSELTGATEGCHVYKAEINLVVNSGGSKIIEATLVTRSEMGA